MKNNIIFIIDTLQAGGAEKSLLEIISGFKKYRPVMLVLYDSGSDLDFAYRDAGIEVIRLEQSVHLAFGEIAADVIQKITPLQPVLIHSTLYRSDMVSRIVARRIGIPLVNGLVNNSYSLRRYFSEPWTIKLKLLFIHLQDLTTARWVTAFIANSGYIAAKSKKALFLKSSKIRVIYRGRTPSSFQRVTVGEIAQFRAEYGLKGKQIWLNAGRLIPRKGHFKLLKAFASLAKINSEVVLMIAGDGPLKKELKNEIAVLGLEDRIILLGTRLDIPLLMRSSDYFVFPTLYEGLPGVLIEAMMARLPVLASDIPENRECISEDMALFHRCNDQADLFRKMKEAISRTDWKERTDLAYRKAAEKFDSAIISAQYEQVYDEVLNAGT